MRRVRERRLATCDQCGQDCAYIELRRQRGILVCRDCFDTPTEIAPLNARFGSARENSTSTAAVSSAVVFSFGTAGITTVDNSLSYSREGARRVFYMRVKSTGGAVDITANPQISAGSNYDRLTLQGVSDSDTLKIDDGDGVRLIEGPIILKRDVSLNLSYDTASSVWRETSRS